MKIKQSKGERTFEICNYIFMILLCIVTLYPFLYITALSFNDGLDTLRGGVWLFPRKFTLDNYAKILEEDNIINSFVVSTARTAMGVFISLILISMLAYALLDKALPGRKFFIKYFFITTLFSGGLIPSFILFRDLKLTNTFWVYIFPAIYSFYNMVIIRSSFEGIPASIAESAKMDGAGDLTIYARFYLPLSKPVLATIALFTGVFHWNDWFAGSFYISKPSLKPAATLLRDILSQMTFESSGMQNINQMMNSALGTQAASSTTPQSVQMAFVLVITLPIILIYPFLQKYFVKGVMIGSVKE